MVQLCGAGVSPAFLKLGAGQRLAPQLLQFLAPLEDWWVSLGARRQRGLIFSWGCVTRAGSGLASSRSPDSGGPVPQTPWDFQGMALVAQGGEEASATLRIRHGTPEGCLKKSIFDTEPGQAFTHRFSRGTENCRSCGAGLLPAPGFRRAGETLAPQICTNHVAHP